MRGMRQIARAAAVLAGAAGVLLLTAPRPPARVSAIGAWCATGGVDIALSRAASLAAWGCLAWITVVTAATLAGQAPSTSGRLARFVARIVAPAAVRATVEAAFGVAVVALPVLGTSSPALAEHRPPAPTWSPPSLDRPGGLPARATTSWTTPTPRRVTAARPRTADAAADDRYVVRRGDCLWTIAAAHLPSSAGPPVIARTWPRWYAANRAVVGPDPDLIRPGEHLTVPPGTSS